MPNVEYRSPGLGEKINLNLGLGKIHRSCDGCEAFFGSATSPICLAGVESLMLGASMAAINIGFALSDGLQNPWVISTTMVGFSAGAINTIVHTATLYNSLAHAPGHIDTSNYKIKGRQPDSDMMIDYLKGFANKKLKDEVNLKDASYADVYGWYAGFLLKDAVKVSLACAGAVLVCLSLTVPQMASGFPEISSMFHQAASALVQGVAAAAVPWVAGKLLRREPMLFTQRRLATEDWKVVAGLENEESLKNQLMASIFDRLGRQFPRPFMPVAGWQNRKHVEPSPHVP